MLGRQIQNRQRILKLVPALDMAQLSGSLLHQPVNGLTAWNMGQQVLHSPVSPPSHCCRLPGRGILQYWKVCAIGRGVQRYSASPGSELAFVEPG